MTATGIGFADVLHAGGPSVVAREVPVGSRRFRGDAGQTAFRCMMTRKHRLMLLATVVVALVAVGMGVGIGAFLHPLLHSHASETDSVSVCAVCGMLKRTTQSPLRCSVRPDSLGTWVQSSRLVGPHAHKWILAYWLQKQPMGGPARSVYEIVVDPDAPAFLEALVRYRSKEEASQYLRLFLDPDQAERAVVFLCGQELGSRDAFEAWFAERKAVYDALPRRTAGSGGEREKARGTPVAPECPGALNAALASDSYSVTHAYPAPVSPIGCDAHVLVCVESVREYARTTQGEWMDRWYVCETRRLRTVEGTFAADNLNFAFPDSWPTAWSGIMVKRGDIAYRPREVFLLGVETQQNQVLIVHQEKRSYLPPYGPYELPSGRKGADPIPHTAILEAVSAYFVFARGWTGVEEDTGTHWIVIAGSRSDGGVPWRRLVMVEKVSFKVSELPPAVPDER